jgi:hypothetical protein
MCPCWKNVNEKNYCVVGFELNLMMKNLKILNNGVLRSVQGNEIICEKIPLGKKLFFYLKAEGLNTKAKVLVFGKAVKGTSDILNDNGFGKDIIEW